MPDINLHKAYDSDGESVLDLFDRNEECVPLYQREYTWEEENINQLFDDIILGIRELSNEDGDNATTFLGTTILTNLADRNSTIQPGDTRAKPTAVQVVIDGQQRFSTIALLTIQLVERLRILSSSLPNKQPYTVLQNQSGDLLDTLPRLYSLKLGRGADPLTKPKIIRLKEDRWAFEGDDSSYCSPVAHYIATYIRTHDLDTAFNAIDPVSGARVRNNVDLIGHWLDAICDAHLDCSFLLNQFPVGHKIVTKRMQEYVIGFHDAELEAVIAKLETDKNENDYFAVAIYHIFLLIYYLLRRCGVNCLHPTYEEWGFDMFQALNATGTPLTAMETFLPQVMQAEEATGSDWGKTPSSESLDEIDRLFEQTKSNEQKTRRTNELLNAFALCFKGEKLGNKFSTQRRWLTGVYEKGLPTIAEKRKFVNNLARASNFFYAAWYMEDKARQITGLEDHDDGDFVSFLVQYLKDANSRLSAPILARYYSQALEDDDCIDEFVDAAKSCAAFFTLWRTAKSTSGLDNIYRRFFDGHSWTAHPKRISSKHLKEYFLEVLVDREIAEKESWITASKRYLLYTEVKTICRFVLFLAGHDRVPDDTNPGLTGPGKPGVCPLLNLDRWTANDHKSLEHVAPQHPPNSHTWDDMIYIENKVHEIGNLLLSPIDLNKSVDNKNWPVKFLHYSHVGVRSVEEIEKLRVDAEKQGIVLSKKAIKILSDTRYNCAVEPVLELGLDGSWNADLINRRTQQIKEIAWEKLSSWLQT